MKDVPGFEGLYAATSDGRVWSYPKHFKEGYWLKQSKGPKGKYLIVQLWRKSVGRSLHVHRLIAKTYLPNPLALPQINHKNGIKTDNRTENLEWCTAQQNMDHAKNTNLLAKGSRNYSHKLSEEKVLQIKERLKSTYRDGSTELAREFGVTRKVIWLVKTGRAWSHV